MIRSTATLFVSLVLSTSSVFAAEVTLPASNLVVEQFVPLDQLPQHPNLQVIRAVDPLAVYSNVTTFLGSAHAQGPAAGVSPAWSWMI